MELSEMKSNLKMKNLYFSSCSVERACKVENGECKADCSVILQKLMNMNMI